MANYSHQQQVLEAHALFHPLNEDSLRGSDSSPEPHEPFHDIIDHYSPSKAQA